MLLFEVLFNLSMSLSLQFSFSLFKISQWVTVASGANYPDFEHIGPVLHEVRLHGHKDFISRAI